jgi:hypothetical protein
MAVVGNNKSNGKASAAAQTPKMGANLTGKSIGKSKPAPAGGTPRTGAQPVKAPVKSGGAYANSSSPATAIQGGNHSPGTALSKGNVSKITALSGGMSGRGNQPGASKRDIGVHTKNAMG